MSPKKQLKLAEQLNKMGEVLDRGGKGHELLPFAEKANKLLSGVNNPKDVGFTEDFFKALDPTTRDGLILAGFSRILDLLCRPDPETITEN